MLTRASRGFEMSRVYKNG